MAHRNDPVERQRQVRIEESNSVTVERDPMGSGVRLVGPPSDSGGGISHSIGHGVGRIVSNAAHDINERFSLGYENERLRHMPRPFNPAGGMYLDVETPRWEVVLHDRLGRADDMVHFWNVERLGGPPSWPHGIGDNFSASVWFEETPERSFDCFGKWSRTQTETFLDFAEKVGDRPFSFPESGMGIHGGPRKRKDWLLDGLFVLKFRGARDGISFRGPGYAPAEDGGYEAVFYLVHVPAAGGDRK